MGWFGIGGKGNNPIDQVQIPEDQMPPEVEKPGSISKAIQSENKMAQMGSNWEAAAQSMQSFSNTVLQLKQEGAWKEALTVFNSKEKTQQEEFKKLTEERKLQIEEIKLQALREESQRAAKMKEKEHELAMRRAQYEDQLREKRKEADLQKEIEAQQRIEQAKRDTIVFEQEQQMKNEEEKAMIHARAQAAVERENHELRMEQTRAEAKEMGKAQTKISEIQSEFFYKNLGRILSNEDNMLVNTAVSLGGIAIAGIITYKSMSELMRQVAARTSTPNLVQETSKFSLNARAFKHKFNTMLNRIPESPKTVFAKPVQEKVEDIMLVTRSAVKNNQAHRNVLLYGPPGTGKTLYAKKLARETNLHYAIMSGGDVAPLGSQATYELNKVFDWANASKGMVLFVDEADAFLRPRSENISTELRSVINTFLARTGEPSKKIQIVLATNQVNQIDSAVLDRMNELVEVPLPTLDERELLLRNYLISHVLEPGADEKNRVILDAGVTAEFEEIYKSLAKNTEGMSGREIEKMCSNIFASAVAAEDPTISSSLIKERGAEYKAQSERKAEIRKSQIETAV